MTARWRDPTCRCLHGPAVHAEDGSRCLLPSCSCRSWRPVPWVDPHRCARVDELEATVAALLLLLVQAPVIPQQRQPIKERAAAR